MKAPQSIDDVSTASVDDITQAYIDEGADPVAARYMARVLKEEHDAGDGTD